MEQEKKVLKLKKSRYLTILPQGDNYLIVQGYSGAIVLINKNIWNKILLNSNISDGQSKLEQTIINLLSKKILVPAEADEIDLIKRSFDKSLEQAAQDPFLGLFLTMRCNFACPYCFQNEKQSDITKEIIDKSLVDFFDKIREAKAEKARIEFWGGEPLLCLDKLEYAVRKSRALSETKNEFTIVTNGSIFDPQVAELFSKEKDLMHVQIPIDGPEDSHDRRRFFKGGTGSYQIIFENLPQWMKIAKKVVVRVNIDQENKDDIPKLFEDLAEFNRGKIGISLGDVSSGWGRGKTRKEVLDNRNYKEIESELYALAEQMGFNVLRGKFPKYQPILCMAAGVFSGWVSTDGQIHCCAKVAGNSEYSLGNITDGCQSQRACQWIKHRVINNDQCLKCKHLFFCGGICLADAMQGTKVKGFCGSGFKRQLQKNLDKVIKQAEIVE